MFEKLIELAERIAVALERIAAYANNGPKTGNAASPGKTADKAKEEPSTKTSVSGKPSSASQASDTDDGLGGDDDKPVTFESMRAKIIEVKSHPKLGKDKSNAIVAKYGKVPDIKEKDFVKVYAECEALLKKVGG